MGTYEQSHKYIEGALTPGTQPPWYTAGGPVQAIASQSPGGPGDILIRSELSIHLGFTIANATLRITPLTWPALSVHAAGEVYSVGTGGFPDPTSSAAPRAVIRGKCGPSTGAMQVWNTSSWEAGSYDLDNIVSRGKRGPAFYGAGHPELRIGLWVGNIGNTQLLFNTYNSWWAYDLSCIWYVP